LVSKIAPILAADLLSMALAILSMLCEPAFASSLAISSKSSGLANLPYSSGSSYLFFFFYKERKVTHNKIIMF
jgi:hypothetical protein